MTRLEVGHRVRISGTDPIWAVYGINPDGDGAHLQRYDAKTRKLIFKPNWPIERLEMADRG